MVNKFKSKDQLNTFCAFHFSYLKIDETLFELPFFKPEYSTGMLDEFSIK